MHNIVQLFSTIFSSKCFYELTNFVIALLILVLHDINWKTISNKWFYFIISMYVELDANIDYNTMHICCWFT